MKSYFLSLMVLLVCVSIILGACGSSEPSLEFGYLVDHQTYYPGDKVQVTVMVKNVGNAFRYNGPIIDHFSNGVLSLGGGDYQIETNNADVVTACVTEYKFLKNSTESYVYTFTIPENAPEGDYSLSFWIFGVKAEFDDVIYIS